MDNTLDIKEFSYGKTEIINIIIPLITLCIGLPLIILGFFADVLNICISIFSRSAIEMKLLVELVVILLCCEEAAQVVFLHRAWQPAHTPYNMTPRAAW